MPVHPADPRTNRPLIDEVPRLLEERGLSSRRLALLVGVSPSHLSRVLRKKQFKTPSGDLARRIALALDLPEDYFAEFREATVFERLRADPDLRDSLYDQFQRTPGPRRH